MQVYPPCTPCLNLRTKRGDTASKQQPCHNNTCIMCWFRGLFQQPPRTFVTHTHTHAHARTHTHTHKHKHRHRTGNWDSAAKCICLDWIHSNGIYILKYLLILNMLIKHKSCSLCFGRVSELNQYGHHFLCKLYAQRNSAQDFVVAVVALRLLNLQHTSCTWNVLWTWKSLF
jgi:hypothetical protein